MPCALGALGLLWLLLGSDGVYNAWMIRKQLYLEASQDRALKRRAKELGVSQAELLRRALDAVLATEATPKTAQARVLADLLAEADVIASSYSFGSYRFHRQALAEEDHRHTKW